jgi:hypothetical protein
MPQTCSPGDGLSDMTARLPRSLPDGVPAALANGIDLAAERPLARGRPHLAQRKGACVDHVVELVVAQQPTSKEVKAPFDPRVDPKIVADRTGPAHMAHTLSIDTQVDRERPGSGVNRRKPPYGHSSCLVDVCSVQLHAYQYGTCGPGV